MRRRLVLMRHAKSDWSTAGRPDHGRPLNLRGRLAAPLMAAYLAEQPFAIDCALVSDAVRTQETWARMRPLLPDGPEPRLEPQMYEAPPDALLAALRAAPDAAQTVLMIGHNPGMETFAAMLTAPGSARPGRFPTAALAVFHAALPSWAEAGAGRFGLEAYEEPKGLV